MQCGHLDDTFYSLALGNKGMGGACRSQGMSGHVEGGDAECLGPPAQVSEEAWWGEDRRRGRSWREAHMGNWYWLPSPWS